MYTIKREEDRITIFDWNGQPVYTTTKDAYLVHGSGVDKTTVEKVGDMPDAKLLTALANAKKLAI